jgi:lysophospholipase L1-like esterase
MRQVALLLFFQIVFIQMAICQDQPRFQSEINLFKSDTTDYTKIDQLILFTGSSSVRMWDGLTSDFPQYSVLNRGFGGSYMSELLFYSDTIILQCKPAVVFIYEGDNDIASGKTPEDILNAARELVGVIRKELPETMICFISAKPSLARWKLKEEYLAFNSQLKAFTLTQPNVWYIDVWTQATGADGNPLNDLFLDDKLHLNRKGYDIWRDIVGNFLRERGIKEKS